MNPLKISLRRKEVLIHVENADGEDITYCLREMDGASRDSYLSLLSEKVLRDDKGNPIGVVSHEGLQSELLSRCLYDEMNALIPKETINKWPASVVHLLFQEAQKVNALTTDSAKEAGNG